MHVVRVHALAEGYGLGTRLGVQPIKSLFRKLSQATSSFEVPQEHRMQT